MENSTKLTMRIQRNNNLNDIYFDDVIGPGNGRHHYHIVPNGYPVCAPNHIDIQFQCGPRNEPNSIHGVLDTDLIEIVRHRLQCFQKGEYATRENACALTHLEEALMWMNKRTEDRAERGVLGTMQK